MMNYVVEYGRTLSPSLVHFGHSKLVSVSELWVSHVASPDSAFGNEILTCLL